MLENMQLSRKSGDESRVLPASVIENKLEQILLTGGEERLNEYRADQSRIIVPTVFREDYILALRKLTRHNDPMAYVNVMTKLHQFSDNLYGNDFTELKNYLAACNAYEEPSQAKLQIIDRSI